MSKQLINKYHADLDRLRTISGSRRESVLREAFKDLLKDWGRAHDRLFVAEHDIVTAKANRIYLDGALLHSLRVPFGYWEAKDENDDLAKEIEAKFRKGYPKDNIIFTDDVTAILWQNGHEADRAAMDDTDALLRLMTQFFAYERQEVADFNKAVKQFATDLPEVLKALRDLIGEKRASSSDFARAEQAFLDHARDAINPTVSEEDVQEMLIQHILTEDIFAKVFDNPEFHQQNNVAKELYTLEAKLFGYGEKSKLLKALAPYYAGIDSTASLIDSHSEKQGFLKALYENFYKVYNPLAADRLGVVYTPGEIVRFMIRSADWLCEQHFGKNLVDKGVEILDPATGTGTFIVELLEHFRGNHDKLRHKYKEELHANEVAILPYYVANLNIEATYAAITGQFAEYPNLCFVDTLDNVAALGIYSGHQHDMFGAIADENMGRIKRQNDRKISVIIGNPPYNANQQNENDNNKNRTYARIDERIKQTYIKASTAQKTKQYDMYKRFIRWASDRLGGDGVIAFITNRAFIDAHQDDGFRRTVAKEFTQGWIVDLGGDYKLQGVGGTGNVFGIGTGVAISFWIKRKEAKEKLDLFYIPAPAGQGGDKLSWLTGLSMNGRGWSSIAARDDAEWINLPTESVDGMLPLADKKTKGKQGKSQDLSLFKTFSLGISTNRDEWLFDRNKNNLKAKTRELSETYNSLPVKPDHFPNTIKWSRNLKRRLAKNIREPWSESHIIRSVYRPFCKVWLYQSPVFVDELGGAVSNFPSNALNSALCISKGKRGKFSCLSTNETPALDWFIPDACQYFPRYRYTKSGERIDNITDWAVQQFENHYGERERERESKVRARISRTSAKTRSSPIAMPCSTIPSIAKNMRSISSANFRASPFTPISPNGQHGGKCCSTSISAMNR